MRIVYIAFSGIPSKTAQSINVCRACSALAELGHEVTLLVPATHPERLKDESDWAAFYDLPDNFTVKFLAAPAFRGGRTLFTWLAARYCQRSRADLIIGRYLRATQACASKQIPVIYELHAPVKGKGSAISRLALSGQLRLLVTHSLEVKRNVLEHHLHGLLPERVFSIPNGREALRHIAPKAKIEKTTNGFNIGYVGKLQAQKGMSLIADLSARLPNHDFHLIGGDAEQIATWQPRMNAPHVHFHGYIPQSEVGRYIQAMDLCLLPNEPHASNPAGILYSSPMKVLDYMAFGKTILATDVAEIREMLSDQEAILLPLGDVDAWRRAVETLDSDTIKRLGCAAKTRMEQEFTMRARYEKILVAAGFAHASA